LPLVANWLDGVDVKPGDLVLCENVRFNVGEKADDDKLAKRLAGAVRRVRHGRFWHGRTAPRRARMVLRGMRPSHARVRCSLPELEALWQGALRARSATDGDHRRVESLDEDRNPASVVDEGRRADPGWRHRQYDPRGIRRQRRQVAALRRDMIDFAAKLLRGEFGKAKIPLPVDAVVAKSLDAASKGAS
jgi:hypothetical protein